MLRVLFFAAVITLATSADIDEFMGAWAAVKCDFCPKGDQDQLCKPFIFEKTKETDKCGDQVVPLVKITAGPYKKDRVPPVPAIIANNEAEVEAALKITCEKYIGKYVVFHKLSDNYITLNIDNPRGQETVLFAKNLPTETELEEFVKKLNNPRIKGEGCIKKN